MKTAHPVGLSDPGTRRRPLILTLLIVCVAAVAGGFLLTPLWRPVSAVPLPQDSFENYVVSNDRFGTKLFRDLLAEDPDKNLVFSPLGISSLFACLREGTLGAIRNELDKTFEWKQDQELGPSHKRLAARFILSPVLSTEEDSKSETRIGWDEMDRLIRDVNEGSNQPKDAIRREEFWLKNSLHFHGNTVPKAFSKRFLDKAKNDFGLEFDEVSDAKEWDAAISRFPAVRSELSSGTTKQSILILSSVLNLRTRWRRGQFGVNDFPGEFMTGKGSGVPVTMLVSFADVYSYAKTESYEAVVLPAKNADFVVVMPDEEVSLKTLADEFAENPHFLVPQLKQRSGEIELPVFNFARKEDFRSRLENLGAKTIFSDLGNLVKIPYSRLLAVEQTVSLEVDIRSIQTKAWTYMVGLIGGRLANDEGFHMKINRPFLFQIRDNQTGVLLFMGAVTDPSSH